MHLSASADKLCSCYGRQEWQSQQAIRKPRIKQASVVHDPWVQEGRFQSCWLTSGPNEAPQCIFVQRQKGGPLAIFDAASSAMQTIQIDPECDLVPYLGKDAAYARLHIIEFKALSDLHSTYSQASWHTLELRHLGIPLTLKDVNCRYLNPAYLLPTSSIYHKGSHQVAMFSSCSKLVIMDAETREELVEVPVAPQFLQSTVEPMQLHCNCLGCKDECTCLPAVTVHWSPDGSMLAVALASTNRSILMDEGQLSIEIQVYDTASGKCLQAMPLTGYDCTVAWSGHNNLLAVWSMATRSYSLESEYGSSNTKVYPRDEGIHCKLCWPWEKPLKEKYHSCHCSGADEHHESGRHGQHCEIRILDPRIWSIEAVPMTAYCTEAVWAGCEWDPSGRLLLARWQSDRSNHRNQWGCGYTLLDVAHHEYILDFGVEAFGSFGSSRLWPNEPAIWSGADHGSADISLFVPGHEGSHVIALHQTSGSESGQTAPEWSTSTKCIGQPYLDPETHIHGFVPSSLSPDNRYFLSQHADCSVYHLDLATRQEHALAPHLQPADLRPHAVAFAPFPAGWPQLYASLHRPKDGRSLDDNLQNDMVLQVVDINSRNVMGMELLQRLVTEVEGLDLRDFCPSAPLSWCPDGRWLAIHGHTATLLLALAPARGGILDAEAMLVHLLDKYIDST